MAFIVYNRGGRSLIDTWLGGAGSAAGYSPSAGPQLTPAGSGTVGDWGVGLGTSEGGVGIDGIDKTVGIAAIAEVGTGTAAGYGRAAIQRSQAGGGWPAATLVGGSYQSSGPQVEFTFTGEPVPNSATMWFMAGNTTLEADNALFGADLSQPNTFQNGDIQRIQAIFKVS